MVSAGGAIRGRDSYPEAKLKTNDRSCVIKVSSAQFSALLTADIEALQRTGVGRRCADQPTILRSDVLLMPHHGSLASSTPAFIDAVAPKLALINAGYRKLFPVIRATQCWHAIANATLMRCAPTGTWRNRALSGARCHQREQIPRRAPPLLAGST